MTVPYKPCSSPFEAVQTIFAETDKRGMSLQDVSNIAGYGTDTIKALRRPRIRGDGLKPSLRMIIDMAQSVGLKIVAVPIEGKHHE